MMPSVSRELDARRVTRPRARRHEAVATSWRRFPEGRRRFLGRRSQVPTAALVAAEAGLASDHDGLRAMLRTELGKDARDVIADGLLGNAQAVSDLGVGLTARNAIENLPFACGQRSELLLRGIIGLLVH